MFGRGFLCLSLLLVLVNPHRVRGQANGIYADFTTSMGCFTCKLEYAFAPKTVANFIGLATGQRPWLDLSTGLAKTNPFYNGITFHRVITNFVIQAGSPKGDGTDGPGYFVPDEITTSLRFTKAYMLAMANSGTNSNGSQFFLTVSPQTGLNNGYTIFGELVGGTNTVLNINHVAVDANDKPLTNVSIQSVGIRRVGTAAQAFDINTNNLPFVTNLPLQFATVSTQISLAFSNRLYADNRLYSSTNLANWGGESLGIEIALPATNSIQITNDSPQRFFRMGQVQYATSTLSPKNLLNRRLVLTITSAPSRTVNIQFDSSRTGTFTSGSTTGSITDYNWTQEPYRGFLLVGFSTTIPVYYLNCDFSGTGGGRLSGTAYPNYPFTFGAYSLAGRFTVN